MGEKLKNPGCELNIIIVFNIFINIDINFVNKKGILVYLF